MPDTTITLTPEEQLFRTCLLACRKQMQHVPGMKDLELRWTGGWVRDKLLGVQSHDIDVALSTMTGWQFGQALQAYMKDHGGALEKEAESRGIKAGIKNLAKIEANPEKSKHLETITTRMFGIDVDFVNLRKEVYHDDSRNPEMEFGTPEEDALRRDACVNALFYNLDSQQVEDFTARGLQDMDIKLIRTPLAPYQTFKDDPLRVLRLIRFAARLGYTIDPDALQAMTDPTIHEALRLKISRERVGVEIGKIMTGPDPACGFTYLYNANLYLPVFGDPEDGTLKSPDASEFMASVQNLSSLVSTNSPTTKTLKPQEDPTVSWSLAAYVPYRHNEKEAVSAARNGIKATNAVSKVLADAVKFRERLNSLAYSAQSGQATRSQVGMLLRECGRSWRSHVLYSFLCEAVSKDLDEANTTYSIFVDYIATQDLNGAAEIKPLLNGNEIKKVLEIAKAGNWIRAALDTLVDWQFANPAATVEDAKAFVISKKDSFLAG